MTTTSLMNVGAVGQVEDGDLLACLQVVHRSLPRARTRHPQQAMPLIGLEAGGRWDRRIFDEDIARSLAEDAAAMRPSTREPA